jgi:hypothetical protein
MLLRFAEVEADGGRDLVRAAETTLDPTLRLLFLRHAGDEARHAAMFRQRGQAFLHLSEKAAAQDFRRYVAVLAADPPTRTVFQRVVKDEFFHMSYTRAQLLRLAPQRHGWLLWRARLRRMWKLYLRLAGAVAGLVGAVVLTVQYFVLLPPFALLARRAAAREPQGWKPIAPDRGGALDRQY